MKKIFTIIIILLAVQTFAQEQDSSTSKSVLKNFHIGAKVGANFSNMHYSDIMYNLWNPSMVVRQNVGIFVDYDLPKNFSIGLDFAWQGRGTKLSSEAFGYQFDAHYLDFQIPVTYTFLKEKRLQPYLQIAPDIAVVSGGNIDYSGQTNYNINISKGNIADFDFGVNTGIGVKIQLAKNYPLMLRILASHYFGLLDTFSKSEHDASSNAVNLDSNYEIYGTRRNSTSSLIVGVDIPLSIFKKNKQKEAEPSPEPEPIIEKPEQTDTTPVVEPTPIVEVPGVEPVDTSKTVEKEPDAKQGVTKFLKATKYLSDGYDIADQKITLFNIKFDTNKAIIKEESKSSLDEIHAMLLEFPNINIHISGHTDSKGNAATNDRLSRERAKAIYDYFVNKGISEKRLSYEGFGSRKPIDTNDTEEGRAKNRRVEFTISK